MTTSPIEKFVEELSEEEMTDLLIIVASQDPTELVGGSKSRPRWNKEQRELLIAANNAVEAAGLEVPSTND